MVEVNPEELSELLSAHLDGELGVSETQLVESVLRNDESARQLMGELRRTKELVATLPRHAAPGSIAADIQFKLERTELLGTAEEPSVPFRGRRTSWTARLSTAAMLGLIGVVGWWFLAERGSLEPGPGPDAVAMVDKGDEEALGLAADMPLARSEASEKAGRVAKPRSIRPRREASFERASRGGADKPRPGPSAEEKLASGTDVAGLRAHAFASESIRLKLLVGDRAKGEVLAARIAGRLSERRSVNLAGVSQRGSMNASTAGSFYYRGKAGLNFNKSNTTQILVRASRKQVEGLLEEIASSADATDRVTLAAGSAEFSGVRRTRQALRLLTDMDAPAVVDSEFVRELLETVGVDRRLFASSRFEAERRGSEVPEESAPGEGEGEAADREIFVAANAPVEISNDMFAEAAESRREPGKLVDHGRREVKESGRATGAKARSKSRRGGGTSRRPGVEVEKAGGVAAKRAGDRYVTFVIEVIATRPDARPTAAPAPSHSRPRPPPRKNQPTERSKERK